VRFADEVVGLRLDVQAGFAGGLPPTGPLDASATAM